jgi:hypothetical protein
VPTGAGIYGAFTTGSGGNGAYGGGGAAGAAQPGYAGQTPGSGGNVTPMATNYFSSEQPYIIPGSVGLSGTVSPNLGGAGGPNSPASIVIGNVTVNSPAGGAGGSTTTSGTVAAGSTGTSGIAYITYSSPTQLGTGGNVWSYTQGGYTYWMHQFTSNGTYIA